MQCYVPVAVLSPPMCKVTDGYSQHGDSPCFSTKQKKQQKKNKNDSLTFPKWIICILMCTDDISSGFLNPSCLRVRVRCRTFNMYVSVCLCPMCAYECVFTPMQTSVCRC